MRSGSGERSEADLRAVEIGEAHMERLADDFLHFICGCLLVVEFAGAALGDQAGGDVEGEEILKLDVAGAVEDAGSGEVDGADSP